MFEARSKRPALPPPDDGNLEPRQPYIEPAEGEEPEPSDKIALFSGEPIVETTAPPEEQQKRRHQVLMETLDEEGERQAEERLQAQIDDDYYHHLQWTQEDAKILTDRGQAPLVFNVSRGTIDWLAGTERRLRKDYKVRPREKNDEQLAEVKTNLFKYVDDVNLGPFHRSQAAKQCFTSGLGWLEEGISLDPDQEMIFCGSEDWRRVIRDSRGRQLDQEDWRYIHRRKILDLDYAMALLPKAKDHLRAIAGRWGNEEDDGDGVWYLGQRLTAAHAHGFIANDSILGGDYSVRTRGSSWDRGRRNSVELIESWYRVPETVKVFAGGPQFRKIVNPADPGHQQLMQDGHPMYQTVKMRMRCMVGTRYEPCWDGPSPFNHGKFILIPMFGYRRGRDGLLYGAMRGMRDPQDDLNKRRSKAQHALASNRITATKNAFDDVEEARQEAARNDGILLVDSLANVRYEKYMGDVTQNLEMAQENIQFIRDTGGVTGDNLGQKTNATSGKAIIAKQEQGSMTTYELFDNYFLAFKLAGQIRLSHIEQFCNQPWAFRIDPQNAPAMWVKVNEVDPRTGQIVNDITASQADFIIDSQDYRATITQSAMQSMFELLGQLATFAPAVVLNLLDLAVENADVQGKEEWVARIRQMNGMRDPKKPPTPQEQAADQQKAQQDQMMKQITMDTAQAKLKEILAKVDNSNADKVLKSLQGLLAAVEAAATVATMPGVAVAADGLAKAAGFEDQTPADPVFNLSQPVQAAPPGVAPGATLSALPAPGQGAPGM